MAENYGVENIQHLETREAIRTRIQMYLGSDDTDGIYQALKEIINNSTDEAIAGYGKEIDIRLDEESNTVEVRDYGRGVPFGVKDGRNFLVAIYTESHTGGKFDKNAYKNSSGLNGIGGTAVCMSSVHFLVRSMRDGKVAEAHFQEGTLQDYKEMTMEEFGRDTGGTGTYICFTPDKEVFKNMTEGFSYERICEEIKNIAYLNKGIKFIVETTQGRKKEFYSENGIADFIKDKVKNPLMNAPIIASAKDEFDELEIAFMWTGDPTQEYVFVNGLYCPFGGSPVTGAKTKITTKIKALSGKSFDPELIRKGLVFAINCKVANPSFANQTKSKINNPNLRTLASEAFDKGLSEFANLPEYAALIESLEKFQKAEKAADAIREKILNAAKEVSEMRTKKGMILSKVSDAKVLGENSRLLICEGKSASGSAKKGRDKDLHGIFEARGKIIKFELLLVNLVHGGTAISGRADLVCIELLPPVERSGNIHRYENLTEELTVRCAATNEPGHKVNVIFPETHLVTVKYGVRAFPAIERISHTTNSVFDSPSLNLFKFNHRSFLLSSGSWLETGSPSDASSCPHKTRCSGCPPYSKGGLRRTHSRCLWSSHVRWWCIPRSQPNQP